jgi:hypothetical protein
MNTQIKSLSQIYNEEIWIEISDRDLIDAEPSPQDYSNQTGYHHAYFNRLCLNLFLRWLDENLALESKPKPFLEENLKSIWNVVNGVGINLGSQRLILIPNDAIDTQDFAVPQEWVDLSNWAGNYYLPVQVDLENRYLRVWGFVSHRTLKTVAEYEPVYREYYIECDRLFNDLDTLWMACELHGDEKANIAALPQLTENQAQQLIDRLSLSSLYSPRLEVSFEQWGGLLNKTSWLQQLYQRRSRQQQRLVKLSQWFSDCVEEGWQALEDFIQTKPLIPAMRSRVRGIHLDTPEAIRRAIKQLYASQQEIAFRFSSEPKMSRAIPMANSTAASADKRENESALVYLLQNTSDESIRWQAAEYLCAIANNHPDAPIRKVMDIGIQLLGHPIALAIALLRKSNGQVAILLRVYPMNGRLKLPPGLRLMGLYESGEAIKGLEAISRNEPQDDYISLYFCADVGDRFGVLVSLDDAKIIEQFVV